MKVVKYWKTLLIEAVDSLSFEFETQLNKSLSKLI